MANVVYLVISSIAFVPLKYADCQTYVGDFCTLQSTGALGQCQLLTQCQPAIQALKLRVFPQTCGFQGLEPIVCCCESAPVATRPPPITTTTKRTDATTKPTRRPTTAATWPTTLEALPIGEKSRPRQCHTPEKKEGQCIPLHDCPTVLEAFANPPKGSETYLRQYVCKDGDGIKVCCDNSTSIMMLAEQYLIFDSSQAVLKDSLPFCWTDENRYESMLPTILAKRPESGVEYVKCYGALFNERYVITAAECVAQNDKSQESAIIGVQLTSSKRSYFFGIEELIRHPFYDPASKINDLALLRLNGTVSEDGVRLYLCIEEYDSLKGTELATYNGLNLNASTADQRRKRKFILNELISTGLCREMLKNKTVNAVVTEYDLCTKDIGNSTEITCNEYVGSPLMYNSEPGRNFNNQDARLLGISSSRIGCAEGLPNVYTNLVKYRLWLRDNIRPWLDDNEQCRTPNGEAGRTLPIHYCPALLEMFAHARSGTRAYLDKQKGYAQTFSVCCPKSSSASVLDNRNVLSNVDVPPQFLDERCGLQHRDDYFSSSTAIAIDEFPWIASIVDTYLESQSAGVLINARYVLTAASCIEYSDVLNISVRLGDFTNQNEEDCIKDADIDGTDCTETEYFYVEDMIRHPFYSWEFHLNNVGLLRLNKTVVYTDYIRPICLPVQGTVTAKPGDILYKSGWSVEEGIKIKVLTRVLSYNECQRTLRRNFQEYILDASTMCAIDSNYSSPKSDYGGVEMFSNNYLWHVEGVFDREYYSAKYPDLCANIPKYINWIIENMRPWK